MTKKTAVKKATAKKSVKKAVKNETVEPSVSILQSAKCDSISQKSQLTYNVALNDEGLATIRIASNSGGGFWSREYVPVNKIIDVIQSVPEDQPITSAHLFKLFVAKSQNSPGFLLAVLLKEGLLEPLGKKRQYRMNESGVEKFLAKIDKLKSRKS